MPKQKDLKRLIRSRMQKTGESYTTARAQILRKSPQTDEPTAKQTIEPALPADYVELAGMSDAAVAKATGHTWPEWMGTLDAIDATSLPHREIARHVHEEHDVSQWWAQSVTVGYERIRGLREARQRRGGAYEANKSKTFPVPVGRLFRAFQDAEVRQQWLPDVEPTIRTSQPDKSMRITWPDGTSVHAYFVAKGEEKSQVAIQHVGLESQEAVAEAKELWAARLAALGEVVD